MTSLRTIKLTAVAGALCLAASACATTLDDSAFTTTAVDGTSANGQVSAAGVTTDGTTVPGTTSTVPGTKTGSTVPGSTVPGSTIPGSTIPGSTIPGSTTPGTTTPGSTTPGSKTPGSTTPGSTTSTAPGTTTVKAPTKVDPSLAPVQVGVFYYTGITLGGTSDPVAEPKAIIAYLNAHGGFGGHEVEGVYTPVNGSGTASYATTLQQVCDSWTQDNHVIAGISTGNAPIDLQRCLNSRGVVGVMGASTIQKSISDYNSLPYMVNPSEVVSELQDKAMVDSLVRQHFFKSGDKIGVFYETYAGSANAYKNGLLPELAHYGLKVTDSFAAHFPESTAELAPALASLQTPTLRMKAEGVNKILFAGTGEMDTVTQYANQQKYYPAYGFNTNEQPIVKEQLSYAHSVLPGSMGVGWQPLVDISHGTPAPNAAAKNCLNVVKGSANTSGATQQWAAESYCDLFGVLKAGADRNPVKDMTGTTLIQGIDSLGSGYESPFNFSTALSSSHRWGAATGRDFAYSTKCWCYQYTSSPHAID